MLVMRRLDECSRSNVVVVRTRVGGERSVWFGEVLSRKRIEALYAWLRAGGLRTATPLPATLATFPAVGAVLALCGARGAFRVTGRRRG